MEWLHLRGATATLFLQAVGPARMTCGSVRGILAGALVIPVQPTCPPATRGHHVAPDSSRRCQNPSPFHTYTGNLGDPASPGRIGDVDFDRGEFDMAQSRDQGRMPC